MNNNIKIGIGVMIKEGNKVLMGHRCNKEDTGGIYEFDTWTFPGGKQEYDETIFECAKREVKEETNLDIEDLEIFGASDDFGENKHYVTIHVIAKKYSNELKVMEPQKEDEWRWFDINDLPKNIYSPSKHFINNYMEKVKKDGI